MGTLLGLSGSCSGCFVIGTKTLGISGKMGLRLMYGATTSARVIFKSREKASGSLEDEIGEGIDAGCDEDVHGVMMKKQLAEAIGGQK